MKFPKNKRLRDRKLLDQIKKQSCVACKDYGVDPAHIHSVGAGGPDADFNVIPLCRREHQFQHALGWSIFFKRWPIVWIYLQTLGWYYIGEKLWNDKLRP
jgi:hypothetical protein